MAVANSDICLKQLVRTTKTSISITRISSLVKISNWVQKLQLGTHRHIATSQAYLPSLGTQGAPPAAAQCGCKPNGVHQMEHTKGAHQMEHTKRRTTKAHTKRHTQNCAHQTAHTKLRTPRCSCSRPLHETRTLSAAPRGNLLITEGHKSQRLVSAPPSICGVAS